MSLVVIGLRKRISNLFLEYTKTPMFNPEVSRLLKVSCWAKRNVRWDVRCQIYLNSYFCPRFLSSQHSLFMMFTSAVVRGNIFHPLILNSAPMHGMHSSIEYMYLCLCCMHVDVTEQWGRVAEQHMWTMLAGNEKTALSTVQCLVRFVAQKRNTATIQVLSSLYRWTYVRGCSTGLSSPQPFHSRYAISWPPNTLLCL